MNVSRLYMQLCRLDLIVSRVAIFTAASLVPKPCRGPETGGSARAKKNHFSESPDIHPTPFFASFFFILGRPTFQIFLVPLAQTIWGPVCPNVFPYGVLNDVEVVTEISGPTARILIINLSLVVPPGHPSVQQVAPPVKTPLPWRSWYEEKMSKDHVPSHVWWRSTD